MPDRDVQSIRDLIYYQYSKIIAKRAFSASDGKSAKNEHYGFIKKTFRELKDGIKTWSEGGQKGREARRDTSQIFQMKNMISAV